MTSANLTPSAQERNIEASVRVTDAAFVTALRTQFDAPVRAGRLRRLAGLEA